MLRVPFAWEIARRLNFSDSLKVRFEVPLGKDSDGEPIRLDLLRWTDFESKVALERKAPARSGAGKNSAMTEFRMRFYRDNRRQGRSERRDYAYSCRMRSLRAAGEHRDGHFHRFIQRGGSRP